MSNDGQLKTKIINLVELFNPNSNEELIKLCSEKLNLSRKDSTRLIFDLEDEGKLIFSTKKENVPSSFMNYLFSRNASSFYTTIIIILATGLSYFAYDPILIYARYILGAFYVLFLPGYLIISNIYLGNKIDNIKMTVFSIGISIVIISIIGLALNYLLSITLKPILIIETLIIISLSTTYLIRNYHYLTNTKRV